MRHDDMQRAGDAQADDWERSEAGQDQRREMLIAQGLCVDCSGYGWVAHWERQGDRNVRVSTPCHCVEE